MTTFTGSNNHAPLAALSARVLRGGLRISRDTPRWVQRAARQLRGTSSPTIGVSIEAFTAGIAERFPDLAARFTPPSEAAESHAAIDMPFVSAQGLLEMTQGETPAFESATAFLAHVRGNQAEVAMQQPATPPTPRTTQRKSATAPASTNTSPLEVMRQRTVAARRPATQTPVSPASLQRKAESTTSEARSKPARVISAVEEVPRKSRATSASLSEVTRATLQQSSETPKSPAASSQVEMHDAEQLKEVVTVVPAVTQPDEVFSSEAPQVAQTHSTPSEAAQPPAPVIQRKPATQRETRQQDDTPQLPETKVSQSVVPDAPALQRSSQEQRVAMSTPQREETAVTRVESSPVPASLNVGAKQRVISQNNVRNQPAALPLQKNTPDVALPQILRRVDPTVAPQANKKSSPPALPLLRKANAPQLARAGESAQQTSSRIARMALPSLPSPLTLSNDPSAMVDDAAATANMDALDGWTALPATALALPTMREAMPAAPFNMPAFEMPSMPRSMVAPPLRAALPHMPAPPQIDMPFAPMRNAAQNIGAAAQTRASESFAKLPSAPAMPALPSVQSAASQVRASASAAMAGGVNAISGAVQSGVASADQFANNAMSAAQGALGALNAGTPKTDLDKLARQLLPHLKRMLALERERMRPF